MNRRDDDYPRKHTVAAAEDNRRRRTSQGREIVSMNLRMYRTKIVIDTQAIIGGEGTYLPHIKIEWRPCETILTLLL